MILVLGQNAAWQLTYRTRVLDRGGVNRMTEAYASAAGKGANAARALTLLGCRTTLVTYSGGETGVRYIEDCRNDGIELREIEIGASTRICTTIIEDDGTVTEIIEPSPHIEPSESEAFFDSVRRMLPEASLLVISGTAVSGEPDSRYREYIEAAHAHDTPVLLDSYRTHGRLALEASPEILKINADELSEIVGRPVDDTASRREACESLIRSRGLRWVIITLGSKGAEGYSAGNAVCVKTPVISIANSIGAGDSFTAGVAASVDRVSGMLDENLGEACRMGAAAGTANCLDIKPGRFSIETYRNCYESVTLE